MIQTSVDMIFETGDDGSLAISPVLPPEVPETPPSDDYIQWEDILPWAIGFAAVGTAGFFSWKLINQYNEIPPSI